MNDHTPARWRIFAEEYARTANGTKSAIAAGYGKSGAHTRAVELLRREKIQELIRSRIISKTVHAYQTYRNLILVADAAMNELVRTLGLQDQTTRDPDPMARARMIEAARRAVACVGEAEGIFVQHHKIEGDIRVHDLIDISARIRQKAAGLRMESAVEVPRLDFTGTSIEAPAPDPAPLDSSEGENGNGHANGNGHEGNGNGKPPA